MLALTTATVAGCTGSGSTGPGASASASAPAPTAATVGGTAGSLQAAYEQVIHDVLPSVVEIRTSAGLGSGIVYDAAGDIVTNDHVVGSSKTFRVQFARHAGSVPGRLVGTFPAGDLAVIKVSGISDLTPARFADSDRVTVGEIVLAMGNPLGLSSSVTNGIVSAVGRTLTEPQSADSPGATLPDSIQTSASINPGNSGGALVDLNGDVIGIPTLAATDAQEGGAAPGIGFAIPSDTVTRIAKQLVASGKVTNSGRAALEVSVTSVAGQTGQAVGAGVVSVVAGGPAAKAGLRAGDIITRVAGHQVSSAQSLSSVLSALDVGQHVQVTYTRGGTAHTVGLTLGQLGSG